MPPALTEQGRLFDANSNPIVGSTTFVFSIYTTATAGTASWTETQTLTLDSGYFSAQLGEVTPFPATLFSAATGTLYLGIKVNTDPELTPRQPLLSAPYALVAQNAVGDITPTSVTVGGTKMIDSTGWVGPKPGVTGGVTGFKRSTSSAGLATIGTTTTTVTSLSFTIPSAGTVFAIATGYCNLPAGGAQIYASVTQTATSPYADFTDFSPSELTGSQNVLAASDTFAYTAAGTYTLYLNATATAAGGTCNGGITVFFTATPLP